MTKNPRPRISAIALLSSLVVGIIAFAVIGERTIGSTASAFVPRNSNKSSGQTGDKKTAAKPKAVGCSKADDAALADQVRDRLSKNNTLRDEKEITVEVSGRVATLTGTVKVRSHKLTAATETKRVRCIKRVENLICSKCDGNLICCHGECQPAPCLEGKKKSK